MDGGGSECALVDSRQVAPIPSGHTQMEAAPLMCAGITIYAAIKKTGLKPGQSLEIIGCGGGLVGHLGLQYATVMGPKIYRVDNSDAALALVRNLNNISGLP